MGMKWKGLTPCKGTYIRGMRWKKFWLACQHVSNDTQFGPLNIDADKSSEDVLTKCLSYFTNSTSHDRIAL